MFPNKGKQNQKWLPHPCLLGGPKEGGNATSPLQPRGSPNIRGQNQKWLPHPCLLGGPQVDGNATSPLHSRGSPKQRGTKSEVGTTPLPSQVPQKGRKCCVTLAFCGSLAKETKSKVAQLGARTKLWMCSPKEYHQKNFAEMVFLRRKTPLKPPIDHFKKGGGSKTPTPSDFSEPP